jgi:hypothetical protein
MKYGAHTVGCRTALTEAGTATLMLGEVADSELIVRRR